MRFKSLDSLKSLTLGKLKEKLDGDAARGGDASVVQIAGMEEQINHRTKGLAETEQQLKELADTVKTSQENGDTQPQPHGPLSELSIDPEDQTQELDEELGIEALDLDADEEIKVVELGAGAATPAEAAREPTKEEEAKEEESKKEEDDSLGNLFSQDEEEENPLANLINSLPDVTAQELLDDLKEINEIIEEWQHH
jgi:TATA-binding protein-associated factor Taf7